MELFIKLEAGYLVIALFILLVSIFVSTRSFMKKNTWKKAVPIVALVLSFFIGLHFFVTTSRINEVETNFHKNKKIICESRAIRKVAQSVIIEKSNDWSLENHMFSSPNYTRKFFSARCLKAIE